MAAVAKAVYVPRVGHYLTNDKVLVLVVGKRRNGWLVEDARAPLVDAEDRPPDAQWVLVPEKVKDWRRVKPEEEHKQHAA